MIPDDEVIEQGNLEDLPVPDVEFEIDLPDPDEELIGEIMAQADVTEDEARQALKYEREVEEDDEPAAVFTEDFVEPEAGDSDEDELDFPEEFLYVWPVLNKVNVYLGTVELFEAVSALFADDESEVLATYAGEGEMADDDLEDLASDLAEIQEEVAVEFHKVNQPRKGALVAKLGSLSEALDYIEDSPLVRWDIYAG